MIDPGQVIQEEMKMADLTSFLLLTITISASMAALSGVFSSLMNALGASVRVFSLLDTTPTVSNVGGHVPDEMSGLLVRSRVW